VLHKSAYADLILGTYGGGINYNLGINRHIEVAGVILLGHLQDPEEGRTIAASFHHPVGAVATMLKYRFTLFCC
jgi:hypothetical protein